MAKSSVFKVRQSLTKLMGASAITLGEGLGRLVLTTSKDIRAQGVLGYGQIGKNILASKTTLLVAEVRTVR